jgi:DNA mismatch repair ATPase MutS
MAQLIDIKMDLAEARRIVIAQIKKENKGKVIVLFKVGDVLKAYDDDAVVIAKHCGLVYNNVGTKDNCTITDITISSDMEFMVYPRMVREGYKLCVIE